jgi:hypothetical protein
MTMKSKANRLVVIAFVLWIVTLACGCGVAKPQPADAEAARGALRTVLEAWKRGEAPDTLEDREPPIHVLDYDWSKGSQLLEYKVDPKDSLFGPFLRCQVQLSVKDRRGKTRTRTVVYNVSTDKLFSVVRENDN